MEPGEFQTCHPPVSPSQEMPGFQTGVTISRCPLPFRFFFFLIAVYFYESSSFPGQSAITIQSGGMKEEVNGVLRSIRLHREMQRLSEYSKGVGSNTIRIRDKKNAD